MSHSKNRLDRVLIPNSSFEVGFEDTFFSFLEHEGSLWAINDSSYNAHSFLCMYVCYVFPTLQSQRTRKYVGNVCQVISRGCASHNGVCTYQFGKV